MFRLYGKILPADKSFHVHKTGGVGSGDEFGPGAYMVVYFGYAHTGRGLRFFCGKQSSETATFVYSPGFENLYTLD